MGNGFGHMASDYSAPSNLINKYIPVRRLNRLRAFDGKEVWAEEKYPEILMELIERFSEKGALVNDFFCGFRCIWRSWYGVNRKWIGCDLIHCLIVFPACKQILINYFFSSIRLGLISPPCNVSERLVPIGSDRFKQSKQTFLTGPSSWSIMSPHVDLRRSDMSILEQDITGNGGMCCVAESSIPGIRSQDQISNVVFASKLSKESSSKQVFSSEECILPTMHLANFVSRITNCF